jgi:urease beta subunit
MSSFTGKRTERAKGDAPELQKLLSEDRPVSAGSEIEITSVWTYGFEPDSARNVNVLAI